MFCWFFVMNLLTAASQVLLFRGVLLLIRTCVDLLPSSSANEWCDQRLVHTSTLRLRQPFWLIFSFYTHWPTRPPVCNILLTQGLPPGRHLTLILFTGIFSFWYAVFLPGMGFDVTHCLLTIFLLVCIFPSWYAFFLHGMHFLFLSKVIKKYILQLFNT